METISEYNNRIKVLIENQLRAGVLCDKCRVEMEHLNEKINNGRLVYCPKCGIRDTKLNEPS